jgi:UDP-N-acetyl-D-mannosaminuronate dehydrogenase
VRVAVLGAAYRGGVKETAFSGVFPVVEALGAAGADARVQDPLFSDDELAGLGLVPHHLGEPAAGAIVQADHDRYRQLGPADLPGVRALVDGRGIVEPARLPGVAVRRLGGPAA